MHFGICKAQKGLVDIFDINEDLRSILISEMRGFLLKKTRTLPMDRAVVEDVFIDSFIDDLRSIVANYWYNVYENKVICIISKGQFIDMYMSRQ